MPSQKRLLYCHCVHAGILPAAVKEAVLRSLCESRASFIAVADLCGLAAQRDPVLKELAASDSLQIAACYPRAVQWLFAAAQAPLRAGSVQILNLRVETAEKAAAAVTQAADATSGATVQLLSLQGKTTRVMEINAADPNRIGETVEALRKELETKPQGAWMPWFPVIDYDRCTQCMQCLSFCLFGVFGVDAQRRIAVQQSQQCKTNCPACSRVCPEAAIIFPKYPSGPINGEAINPAALEREKMKIDVSALLGGDVYQVLRDRSERARSRFSKERDSEKALQERQRCVARLLQGANIPPEVLMALPSAEEIQRRAAEAMAKAQAARENKTSLPDDLK